MSLRLYKSPSKSVYLEDKFGDKLIWAGPETPKSKLKEILNNIDSYASKEELIELGKKYRWEDEMKALIEKYAEILKE